MLRLKTQLSAMLANRSMSASQLSRLSGVSKQTISYWLSGGTPRKLEHLKRVAMVFGVSLDHLCFGVDPYDPEPQPTDPDLKSKASPWKTAVFEIRYRKLE